MEHVPETGTINRLHFSGAGFWYVCHANLGTGFVWYQISAPIRTFFYSKPESSVHVTEMVVYGLSLFTLPLATIPAIYSNRFSGCLGELSDHVAFSHVYFFAP